MQNNKLTEIDLVIPQSMEEIYNLDFDALLIDGHDEAIIGYCSLSERIIYDESKIIEILAREMSEEDALEYYYYNINGAYVGDKTPIFLTPIKVSENGE